MAIGTTPLFSELSGSCGPVDFRTRRNGKIEIGKKRIPANPQSTEQLNTRNAYGRLHELWQNAAWIDKEQYNNIAAEYKISPWNAFLMRHLPIMRLNPVCYIPTVENTGLTTHDFTSNEIDGTLSGATWTQLTPYEIPVINYDGIDDETLLPSTNLLRLGNKGTIRALVIANSFPQSINIIYTSTGGGDINKAPYLFVNNLGRLIGYLGGASAQGIATDIYLSPNILHFISMSWDGLNVWFTCNSEFYQTAQTVVNQFTGDFKIGNYLVTAPPRIWTGMIKDLGILDTPLSRTTLDHLYKHERKFYGV